LLDRGGGYILFLYKARIKTAVNVAVVFLCLIMLIQSTLAIINIYDSRKTALEVSSLLISKDIENLTELFSRIESFSKIMESDENFIYLPAQNVKNDVLEDSKEFKALYEKFGTMVSYSVKNTAFVSSYLFLDEKLPLSYIAPNLEKGFNLNHRADSSSIHSASVIKNSPWMKKLADSTESLVWVDDTDNRHLLCFAKKLSMMSVVGSRASINPLGVFYISYDLESLLKQFELLDVYPSSEITLLYNDEVIYQTNESETIKESQSIRHISSIYGGFNIITNISKNELNESFNRQMISGIAVIVMAFLWWIMVLTYMKRAIVKPITVMAKHLFTDGNSELICNEQLNPEIRVLYENHNHMVKQTKIMMEEKRKSYYKMLQSQINPHFIYNVINSISSISLMKGDYEIANTLSNLVDMIRYGINSPEDLVSLEKEIELIKKFVEIQNFRCNNNIILESKLDKELLSVKIPKLTIQTLVENSIFHSDKNPAVNKITVVVEVYEKDGKVEIMVRDNNSADPELLNRHLNDATEKNHETRRGLGIRNINQRLSFVFGEGYNLIYKKEGDFLCALVTVPKI